MIAIISNGNYTASVQLPVERKQLAGALSYLGANHASISLNNVLNIYPKKLFRVTFCCNVSDLFIML